MFNMQITLPTLLLAPAALAATKGAGDVWTHSPRYDYIIVGGGTSGLVVANRLSEDYNVSVAVIEAGGVELYNPNITDTSKYGNAFSTSVDWQYESVPQTFAGNASQVLRAGKALGGTSNINGSSKTTNLNPTFSSDSCIRQE
jgi:choline dehydrogenase-like flavoprotein